MCMSLSSSYRSGSCYSYDGCYHSQFLGYVFFFFKQKTAYEMRISDWSSDVCSSDLASSAAPSHYIVDGSNIATEGRAMPSLKQLNEIGRASCRERVCQYV